MDTAPLRLGITKHATNRFSRRKKSAHRIGLSDPKKRTGRGLEIGRLRHSQSETNLAALKKGITPRWAMLRRIGFGAGKSPANRTCRSMSPYSAQTVEIASTATQSDVPVAVSEGRPWFATHSATDQRLVPAENVSNANSG